MRLTVHYLFTMFFFRGCFVVHIIFIFDEEKTNEREKERKK